MFPKPESVGIIPRAGYRMGDRQSVEALQWLTYIGWTRNNVTHAGNRREVHLPVVPNVKVDRYCAETYEVFEYMGCFWHGCRMPNRHKPCGNTEENLLSRYEETIARLKKIEDAGYKVVANLDNPFVKILTSKLNYLPTPLSNILQ